MGFWWLWGLVCSFWGRDGCKWRRRRRRRLGCVVLRGVGGVGLLIGLGWVP